MGLSTEICDVMRIKIAKTKTSKSLNKDVKEMTKGEGEGL